MQELQPIVNITPAAMGKLTEALANENAADGFLRIEVFEGGGCACSGGYRYALSLEESPRSSDVVEKVGGLKVVVGKTDAELIRGSKIDYFESLQRSGFKIENPNVEAAGCGCGGH